MKLGLSVHGWRPREQPTAAAFGRLVEQTRAADEAGFDLIWTGHHYVSDGDQKFQPVPTIARLAAESDRMHFGTNLLLPLHHPVVIAEQYATIDAITGGRSVLGPITGYREAEFGAMGVPKAERAGRLAEGVEAIKRLWTGDGVTFDGDHYSFEDVTITPKPIQEPRPPIWIGANKDRAVRRAAEIGDAWLVNPHEDDDTVRRQLGLVDPPSGEGFRGLQPAFKYGFVAETDGAAHDVYGPFMEEKFDWYRRAGQDEATENPEAFGLGFDRLRENRLLVGSPETVAERLVYLEEELGIDCVIVATDCPGLDRDDLLRSIELLGEEVVPRVRERLG